MVQFIVDMPAIEDHEADSMAQSISDVVGRLPKSRGVTVKVRSKRKAGRQDVIQRQYRDSDGYWIELKPGWQNGADPGTHGIVEDTKTEAYRRLSMVKPCACEECRRLLGSK